MDELLRIAVAKPPEDGHTREVARYTVCAEDGQPITDEQRDQAIYTAAVQHRFLGEVEGGPAVAQAAENWVRGKGGVRLVEVIALPAARFVNTLSSVFDLDDKNVGERTWQRVTTTPDDPRKGQPNLLLESIADAVVSLGDYYQWEEEEKAVKITKAATTVAQVVVLTGAAVVAIHTPGAAIAPVLIAQIGSSVSSLASQVVDEFNETPHEFTRRIARENVEASTNRGQIYKWSGIFHAVATSAEPLTYQQAREYMAWRFLTINGSRSSETLDDLTGSWGHWVALGESAANVVGLGTAEKWVQSATTGVISAGSGYGLIAALAESYRPFYEMIDLINVQERRGIAEMSAFEANLGLDRESDKPTCPPIALGVLVGRFEYEKPFRSETLSDGTMLCNQWSKSDPAFPEATRYTQPLTCYVPIQTRIAISLESRHGVAASLVRLGQQSELLDSEIATWRDDSEVARIMRELSPGWYAVFLSSSGRLTGTQFKLTIAPDNAVRRTLSAEVTPPGTGLVRMDPWGGHAGLFRDGTGVRLTADPASGYRFVRWQGALPGGNNPATITMNADRSVTAVFERIATHYDGDCTAVLLVQPDHYCRYSGTNRVFSVEPTGGAQSPWSPELNRTGVKVDPYVDGVAHTIQAQELSDRSWRVEVIGAWGNLGDCQTDFTVEPGQYCTRAGTTEQFRVYAVDELIPSDTRSLFPNGYAVLFSNPVEIDDQEVSVGDLTARRRLTSGASASRAANQDW